MYFGIRLAGSFLAKTVFVAVEVFVLDLEALVEGNCTVLGVHWELVRDLEQYIVGTAVEAIV